MFYYANEYLHTNSKYAHGIKGILARPKTQGQVYQAISTLEAKELAAYRTYFPDCSSYEDFRFRVRQIFENTSFVLQFGKKGV